MRKTKLSLDALQVETFQTAAAGPALRGTVQAHEFTQVTSFCQGCTRDPTCGGGCSTDEYVVCYEPQTTGC